MDREGGEDLLDVGGVDRDLQGRRGRGRGVLKEREGCVRRKARREQQRTEPALRVKEVWGR